MSARIFTDTAAYIHISYLFDAHITYPAGRHASPVTMPIMRGRRNCVRLYDRAGAGLKHTILPHKRILDAVKRSTRYMPLRFTISFTPITRRYLLMTPP